MKWVKIFDSKEAADTHFRNKTTVKIVIGTKEICLALHDGKYFAVSNSCPHQHESLSKGQITPYGEIVCPLHFYRFDLITGRECQSRTEDVEVFGVRTNEQGLFILL